jgi:L-arabinose transport system substrate-binding protein
MKKTVMALILLAVLFASCKKADSGQKADLSQKADSSQKELVFEYFCLSFQVEWAQQIEAALKEQAVIHNFKLLSADPSFSIETQLTQIDAAIVQKIDGAFLWVVDEGQAPAAVSKFDSAGIPVFGETFSLKDSAGNNIAPYVELDAQAVGANSGNWIVQNWESTGVDLSNWASVGVIENSSSQYSNNVDRINGFTNALKEGFPNLRASNIYQADCAAETATTDTTEASYKQVSAVLAGHPEISAWLIFSSADNYGTGAARAVEAAGVEKKTILVSAGGELAHGEWDKGERAPVCWRAACYFDARDYVKYMVAGMLDICQNGKKAADIFPEFKSPGQKYAAIKVSGTMITPANYKEIMQQPLK